VSSSIPPSNTQITEAGTVLRQFAIDLSEGRIKRDADDSINIPALDPRVTPAIAVLIIYRDSFNEPTGAVARQLTPMTRRGRLRWPRRGRQRR
jgi:hypothetical protein